jgi:hypothetical protein
MPLTRNSRPVLEKDRIILHARDQEPQCPLRAAEPQALPLNLHVDRTSSAHSLGTPQKAQPVRGPSAPDPAVRGTVLPAGGNLSPLGRPNTAQTSLDGLGKAKPTGTGSR